MTHFLNDHSEAVTSAIDAMVRASDGRLTRLDGYPDIKVVRRTELGAGKVALISGGGAGHEPTHGGFVGRGLLTAAVSGEIFASPSVEAVLAAARSADTGAGCLFIVKNYTGDRLNFGLAAERARAAGHQVEMVIVADDVALKDSAQPRGIAGTLLVHKIAGSAAESGATLAEVSEIASRVADKVKTLGVSLSGVDIPGRRPGREFEEGKGELGLGIHGEPGLETIEVGQVREIVARVAAQLDHEMPDGSPLALLVNNLGGTSALELEVAVNDLLDTPLGRRAELLIGPSPLMTSLTMKGFSVSAIPLDAQIREALLAPSEPTAAWPTARRVGQLALAPLPAIGGDETVEPSEDPAARKLILAVCDELKSSRERLNALDAKVGDGDTGSTFANAATRVSAEIDALPLADRASLLRKLSGLVSVSMGASSGVLISIMLAAAAAELESGTALPQALESGGQAMQRYGGAKLGDRTMLDALLPALERLSAGDGIRAAADAAEKGAGGTAEMERASAGRAAYVPSSHLVGNTDPGAEAIAAAFVAAAAALS